MSDRFQLVSNYQPSGDQPTAIALATNRARIAERMPKTPRFTPPGATKSRASCPAKNEPSPIP